MTTNTTEDTTMEARAQARFVRVTPQKARRVVDMIRGKSADEAIAILRFAPQTASEPVLKALNSAIANARYAADQTATATESTLSPASTLSPDSPLSTDSEETA